MFIALSDLHLSEHLPLCRNDPDWTATCMRKLRQVLRAARRNACPLLIAGDLFDRSSHSPDLVNRVMALFQKYAEVEIVVVPGNHDIRAHNLELLKKSQVWTLGFLPNVRIVDKEEKWTDPAGNTIDLFPFGSELGFRGGNAAVIHQFAYAEKPWAEAPESGNFRRICRKMDGYKLIVAGDNHEDFCKEVRGVTFLNCGGMLRGKIDEQHRVPKFYLIGDDLQVEAVPFEVEDGVFNAESAAFIKRKDEAIGRAADAVLGSSVIEIDFERNLRSALETDEVSPRVKGIILEALNHAK